MAFFINIALVVLGFLSAAGIVNVNSPYVAIGLFYYVFIYLPGYYLAKYFLSSTPVDRLEMVPVSLCAGYLFFSPVAVSAYILQIKIASFLWIYIPVVAAWLLFNYLYLDKKTNYVFPKLETENWVLWSLFGILAASFFIADHYGGFISGNFLQHVSVIRKLVTLETIKVNSPYLIDFKYPQNVYSTYYLFISLVTWISKLDPIHIWIYLPQFVFPVGLLANYTLARYLFKNNKYALLYLLVYFVYFAVYNVNGADQGRAWYHSELSACNNFIALGIFLPVLITLALRYTEREDAKLLIFLPLLFMADSLIHMYVEGKTYFMLYSVVFFAFLAKPQFMDWKKLFKAAAFASIGLVVFFYFYALTTPNINPDYQRFNGTGGSLGVFFKSKIPLYTDISQTITKDPLTVAGSLSILVALFFLKTDLAALVIFSVSFTVAFVIFNPLMMQLGYKLHPPLERVTRLYTLIPFAMALVFPLYMSGKNKLLARFKPVFILAIAAVLILLLKEAPKRLEPIVYTKQRSLESLQNDAEFFKFIREAIPAGSVVMINTPLTTRWTTYFPHYIIAHAFPFIFPPNINETQRLEDVKTYYNDPMGKKAEEILKKYNVEYVLFMSYDIGNRKVWTLPYMKTVSANTMFHIYKVNYAK